MANTEIVKIQLPSGEIQPVEVPVGMSDDDVRATLKKSHPDLFGENTTQFGPPAPATSPSNDLFRNHPPSLGIRRQQQEPTDKKLARGRAADKVGEVSKDAAIAGGLAATGIGLVEAPLAVAGGIAGNYIGSEGGERIAKHYFPDSEDAATLGRWTGGALGTLAGGKMGDSITFPDEVSLPFGIKMKTPSWLPHTPTPPLGSPENPGYMAKLPTRMPRTINPSGSTSDEVAKAEFMNKGYEPGTTVVTKKPMYPYKTNEGGNSWYGPAKGTESLPPDPDIDYATNQKLNARAGKSITNRNIGAPTTGRSGTGPASTPRGITPRQPIASPTPMGGGIAPEDDSVLTVPEENPPFPGQNPNYAASTPRADLVGQAKTGKPGAAKQLMQLGRKILYTPRY